MLHVLLVIQISSIASKHVIFLWDHISQAPFALSSHYPHVSVLYNGTRMDVVSLLVDQAHVTSHSCSFILFALLVGKNGDIQGDPRRHILRSETE